MGEDSFLGVDKKNFLETATAYNESCKTGTDLDCYKQKEYLVPIDKPSCYAFREGVGTDGDFASGRHVNLAGVKRQVLNDLAWAFSSGFLAGTNVAEYLKKLG